MTKIELLDKIKKAKESALKYGVREAYGCKTVWTKKRERKIMAQAFANARLAGIFEIMLKNIAENL